MKTALITGGLGYIGSHVTKALKQSGWKTLVVDSRSAPIHQYIDQFYWQDIRESLRHIFQTHQIDAVFHLAALSVVSEGQRNPLAYYQTNVVGTLNVLQYMMTFHVPSLVFTSSAAVYGSSEFDYSAPQLQPLHETESLRPDSIYGHTKHMAENIIRQLEYKGIHAAILRLFNVSGADADGCLGESHDPETHLIPRVIQSLLHDDPITLYGTDYATPDGTCVRDYIHVSDAAQAIVQSASFLQQESHTRTFNIGMGLGHSNRWILNRIQDRTGMTATIHEQPRRDGDPPYLIADITAARELLNWAPQYTIDDMIDTTYRWDNHRIHTLAHHHGG